MQYLRMPPAAHLAMMGTFLNLPHATKKAIHPKTIFNPIPAPSPREIWKTLAHIISNISPEAANGVSIGRIRSSEGNISPMAPSRSIVPVNNTQKTGT